MFAFKPNKLTKTSLRRGALRCLLPVAALLAGDVALAGTWNDLQTLGLNANPMDDYNKSWIYRNLAYQGRAWCPLGQVDDQVKYCAETPSGTLTFKPAGDPNEGYPAANQAVNMVIATELTADNQGDYLISVAGNNVMGNTGDGTLSTPVYDPVTHRTTAVLRMGTASGQIISLKWNNVDADFGDLKVMQPPFSLADTEKLTPAALDHYGRARIIRAMDRLRINAVSDRNWAGSHAADKNTLLGYQHSLKGAMDLAASVDAHPWVNVTAQATDAYMNNFMGQVRANLKPNKMAFVEFANEPWNRAFKQFHYLKDTAWTAAGIRVGTNNPDMPISTGRILSISRNDNGVVTIKLDSAHNKVKGDYIYQDVDRSGKIAKGRYKLGDGTSGKVLKFYQGGGAVDVTQAEIQTKWVDSWLSLNPDHELVAPMTGYGKADEWPGPITIKARYEMTRLRALYQAAVNAGIAGRVRLIKGICLAGFDDDIYALAWAREKYGSLAWLQDTGGGIAPAYYMQPANPWNLDTTDRIFAELEDARGHIGWDLIKLKNTMLTLGLTTVNGYEGGPHNDLKLTQDIANAMQIAHRDDPRMATLIQNQWQDWVNRGGGPLVYFHGGATASYNGVSDGGMNNNTWALREGTLSSTGNAVKDQAFSTLQNTSVAVAGVDGVTKGTIALPEVFHAHSGIRVGNNQLIVATGTRQNSISITVTADVAGSYTLALDAASWGEHGTDTVTLYVDGKPVASGLLPKQNIYEDQNDVTALSAPVTLAAGFHTVEIRLAAGREGEVGLKHLRLN